MQTVAFKDLTLRDLVGKTFFISYPLHKLMQGCDGIQIPADADGALAFGYIDATEGLTFEILAPTRMSDTHVFDNLALLSVLKITAKVRSGSVDEDAAVIIQEDSSALQTAFSDHIAQIESFYKVDDNRLRARNDATIDHLRHPNYPDDVQAILYDENIGTEAVWFTLLGLNDEGAFVGLLLNEPEGDFGIHCGDGMMLIKQQDEDNLMLITIPALKLEEA